MDGWCIQRNNYSHYINIMVVNSLLFLIKKKTVSVGSDMWYKSPSGGQTDMLQQQDRSNSRLLNKYKTLKSTGLHMGNHNAFKKYVPVCARAHACVCFSNQLHPIPCGN